MPGVHPDARGIVRAPICPEAAIDVRQRFGPFSRDLPHASSWRAIVEGLIHMHTNLMHSGVTTIMNTTARSSSLVLIALAVSTGMTTAWGDEATANAMKSVEHFDYFSNNWNVVGLKDYIHGSRITPDNESGPGQQDACANPDRTRSANR